MDDIIQFLGLVHNFFLPDVEKYCHDENIAFKVLLIMDNAPSHPDLSYICENVRIEYLPPNTTSLLFESSFMCNLISPTISNVPLLKSQRTAREAPVMTFSEKMLISFTYGNRS